MPRDDRPADDGDGRDVDFVVGEAEDGPDEDLIQPEPAGRSRLRVELGIGALALLVVAVIARGALGGSSTPQADRTTSAAPSSIAPGPIPTGPVTAPPLVDNGIIPSGEATAEITPSIPATVLPNHVPTRHGPSPQACPGHRCAATGKLPTSVDDAIQTAFPESSVEHSVTVRLRGGQRLLWYREVDVRVASELLVLRVEAPAHGQHVRTGIRHSHGEVTTFYMGTLGPWHVSVEVTDPLGGVAELSLLQRLAGDTRIVRT